MTRWKYATQEWRRTTSWAAVSGKEELDAMLAAHGEEGWELIGTLDVGALFLVFKQPDEDVAVPNVG